MKVLLKSLLVWLMLLAVPLQGYASATTLLCAPLGTASRASASLQPFSPAHDHRAMMADQYVDSVHAAGADTSAHQTHESGKAAASGKCSSVSTCCFGAAIVASQAMRMPVETQQFTVIPFDPGSVSAVDLALPERPPQASLT